MLSPINTNLVPRGGWTVTIEGCGPEIKSDNFSDFIKQVSIRLQANKKDKHGWREWAIDLMCQQRPDIPNEEVGGPQIRAMTGDDVKRFLTTMWEIFEKGGIPVSEEIQNKRVNICEQCPRIGYISCHIGCSQITDVVNRFMAGRAIPKFPQIHKMACMECGCTASVKSMWPVPLLREIDKQMHIEPAYHPKCWMLAEDQGDHISAPSSAQPPPEGT